MVNLLCLVLVKDLKAWSDALGVNSFGIKTVAYLSGPFWGTPLAFAQWSLRWPEADTGFLPLSKTRHEYWDLDEWDLQPER